MWLVARLPTQIAAPAIIEKHLEEKTYPDQGFALTASLFIYVSARFGHVVTQQVEAHVNREATRRIIAAFFHESLPPHCIL